MYVPNPIVICGNRIRRCWGLEDREGGDRAIDRRANGEPGIQIRTTDCTMTCIDVGLCVIIIAVMFFSPHTNIVIYT